MKRRLTMTEVYDFVDGSTSPVPLINLSLGENAPEWYKEYTNATNYMDIDYLVVTKYSDFVFSDFETAENGTVDFIALRSLLSKKSRLFYAMKKLTYDKLWEIESISFNPIHNYDSNISRKSVRTGSESDKETESGKNKNSRTETGGTIDKNMRSGSEKDTSTSKLSNKETHSVSSYNTNEIDKNENEQDNEASATHTYNDLLDERTTTFKDRQTVDDEEKDSKRNVTKTYNSVTDTFEETHSGNIGVTTSTAMLNEFVDFYNNYSFFERLIGDFVQFICRADFETEVE